MIRLPIKFNYIIFYFTSLILLFAGIFTFLYGENINNKSLTSITFLIIAFSLILRLFNYQQNLDISLPKNKFLHKLSNLLYLPFTIYNLLYILDIFFIKISVDSSNLLFFAIPSIIPLVIFIMFKKIYFNKYI